MLDNNKLLEYLKELKQQHKEMYYYFDSEGEDSDAIFESGYIQCLRYVIEYIEKHNL